MLSTDDLIRHFHDFAAPSLPLQHETEAYASARLGLPGPPKEHFIRFELRISKIFGHRATSAASYSTFATPGRRRQPAASEHYCRLHYRHAFDLLCRTPSILLRRALPAGPRMTFRGSPNDAAV